MTNKHNTTHPLAGIVAPLLCWYRSQARILPWRENPTPYRVWISEIMLQQTRVEAVKPYFDRFIAALPDVSALAAVDPDALMKLWEGLGYYSRAKNLQKAAVEIVRDFGGELPPDYAALRALPGIGPYTAGAVASIAYGIPKAAVDGNVLRVVTRLLADPADIAKEQTKRRVGTLVEAVQPATEVGDFNQALMELGATVCLPKTAAHCVDCPLKQFCLAFAQDAVARLPVKAAKKPRKIEKKTVFLLVSQQKTALRRRPEDGLLGGLWELPCADGHLSPRQAMVFLQNLCGAPLAFSPLPVAKHIFTHIEWRMTGYAAVFVAPPAADDLHWVTRDELGTDFAVPSAFKSYTAILADYL